MMHLLGVSAVVLCLLAEPASAAAPDEQALADAEEARASGDAVVAAALYEQMWSTTGEVEWLARAGRCRLDAGHYAHAAAYLEQALASPGRLDDRAGTVSALERALQSTAVVDVEVEVGAGDVEAVVIAERSEGDGRLPRLTIRAPISARTAGVQVIPVRLAVGRWTVRVVVGIRERAAETLVLRSLAPQRLVIAGEPRPQAQEHKRSRTWIAAPASFSGASLIAGAALAGASQVRLAEQLASAPCLTAVDIDRCSAVAKQSTYRVGGGALLLGASVGALAGGLTGLVRADTVRRKAWIGEVGSGAALVAIGAGIVVWGSESFTQANASSDAWWRGSLDTVESGARRYAIGTGVLGAGLGLAVAAASGLVAEAVQGRLRRYARRSRWQLAGVGVRF